MNIKFILTRSLVYFVLVLLISTTFVLISSLTAQLFEEKGVNQYIVWIGFSLLIVLGLEPLKNLFARVTDRIFYKDKIDYNFELKELSNIINEEVELASLIEHFSAELAKRLKVRSAKVLLAVDQEKTFLPLDQYFQPRAPQHLAQHHTEHLAQRHVKHHDGQENNLFQNSSFIRYLRKEKTITVIDEFERYIYDLDNDYKQRHLAAVLKDLQTLKAAVAIPIFRESRMTAILIIEQKVSGEAFSTEDIIAFEVLAPQLAAALERSKLYQEVRAFNVKLQKEVEKATADLKKVNSRLQEANEKLKQLDSAKSEFMSIASHQLRTPLAGIMGYLSMMLEGDYGKIPVSQRPVIKEIFDASQRLIRMVNLFLNVTRIEAGRFVMNFAKVQLADVLEEMYHELKPTADKKNIKLIYEKKPLALVEVDTDKIKDVILNLIDNAIKYTPKGSVTVTAKVDKKKQTAHVMVTDTGVGIASEEAKNLFSKFVRGSEIARVAPDGSGLGLFIAKKITEAHGGRIWVESAGQGQGSTFQFEIPLKANPAALKKSKEFEEQATKKSE